MPPWFTHAGGHKLYELLAAILRLAGLSAVAGMVLSSLFVDFSFD
jgi:hypothetical protein